LRVALVGLALLALTACSGGTSATGGGDLATHPTLVNAQNFIRDSYPDAAVMPAQVAPSTSNNYAYYNEGVGYYSAAALNDSVLNLGCTIVHEYEHHLQAIAHSGNNTEYGTVWRDIAETEAYAAGDECFRRLG